MVQLQANMEGLFVPTSGNCGSLLMTHTSAEENTSACAGEDQTQGVSLSDLAFAMEFDEGSYSTDATNNQAQLTDTPLQRASVTPLQQDPVAASRDNTNKSSHSKSSTEKWENHCDAGAEAPPTVIAPAEIAAIMRDSSLTATEKQRRTQVLRTQQFLSQEVASDEFSELAALAAAHAAWMNERPALAFDRQGNAMWPRHRA